LQVGVDQAELSRRWLATKPRSLASHLGVPTQIAETRFEVGVLSKNTISSSVVYRRAPDIPVINERLMKWVLREPHGATLEMLWTVAKSRSYFPVSGVHCSDEDAEAEFAGVHFTAEALGMTFRQPWRPEVDLKLLDRREVDCPVARWATGSGTCGVLAHERAPRELQSIECGSDSLGYQLSRNSREPRG
jgi:hypothetical protein